jgi:2-iminobutanoate/2-iminopropanoate deaminase
MIFTKHINLVWFKGVLKMKTIVQTKLAPQAIGPYSQAIKLGNLLFVSGQLGLDFTGNFTAADISSQTHQALENIKVILEAAGLQMADVVKTTIYLVDLKDFATVNNIYGEYFQAPFPARACVQVAQLPKEALVEIEAIAGQ